MCPNICVWQSSLHITCFFVKKRLPILDELIIGRPVDSLFLIVLNCELNLLPNHDKCIPVLPFICYQDCKLFVLTVIHILIKYLEKILSSSYSIKLYTIQCCTITISNMVVLSKWLFLTFLLCILQIIRTNFCSLKRKKKKKKSNPIKGMVQILGR